MIATGHQSDDYAESVLMHILRGCGTDGLRGIAVRNGDMIRPLLCVSRADVMSYIRENGIRYVEDKTNCDDAYTRAQYAVFEQAARQVKAAGFSPMLRLFGWGQLRGRIPRLFLKRQSAYSRNAP